MWLLIRFITALLLIPVVSGCGFTPIYKKEKLELLEQCSEVKIEVEKHQSANVLTSFLEKFFYSSREASNKKYLLKVKLSQEIVPYAVRYGLANRYNVRLEAYYKLIDITSGNRLTDGNLLLASGYNLDDREFINYMQEDYTLEYGLKDLGDQIFQRIKIYFLAKSNENSAK